MNIYHWIAIILIADIALILFVRGATSVARIGSGKRNGGGHENRTRRVGRIHPRIG
jgi:hypothetical protein